MRDKTKENYCYYTFFINAYNVENTLTITIKFLPVMIVLAFLCSEKRLIHPQVFRYYVTVNNTKTK